MSRFFTHHPQNKTKKVKLISFLLIGSFLSVSVFVFISLISPSFLNRDKTPTSYTSHSQNVELLPEIAGINESEGVNKEDLSQKNGKITDTQTKYQSQSPHNNNSSSNSNNSKSLPITGSRKTENNQTQNSNSNMVTSGNTSNEFGSQTPSDLFRYFTPNQFVEVQNSMKYQNVTPILIPPFITGDNDVDVYIQRIAEDRGYKLRQKSNDKDMQAVMKESVSNLQNKAQEEGYKFVVVSGYRSIEDQREIFISQMERRSVNIDFIVTGSEDEKLNLILSYYSIPGYSKHHSGYTVDFGCDSSELKNFGSSPCFEWISKNNFENAKQFGLVPSYPNDGPEQGPNPEEWEYVWVGKDKLKN